MCELTLEAAGMTREEVAAIPTRRTWYGIVGSHGDSLTPRELTDDHALAVARAKVASADYPVSGPWHVVVLTENLRAPT